jgi:lipopolysaccharide cholinephosphotransferase
VNDTGIDLEHVHDLLFDMLCVVDHICRTHDIEYWVDAGTTLGAVRHNDFLPWDDDVDICMTGENMDSFVAVSDQLPEQLRLLIRRGGRGPTAKVVMPEIHATEEFATKHNLRGENVDFLALDIMEVIAVGNPLLHRSRFHMGKVLALQPISAQMAHSPQPLSAARRLSWYALRAIPNAAVNPLKGLLSGRQRAGRWWTYSLNGAHPLVRWQHDDIWPLSTVVLRGRRFPAPGDVGAYLAGLYGPDYLTPPPPSQRLSHFTEFRRVPR